MLPAVNFTLLKVQLDLIQLLLFNHRESDYGDIYVIARIILVPVVNRLL